MIERKILIGTKMRSGEKIIMILKIRIRVPKASFGLTILPAFGRFFISTGRNFTFLLSLRNAKVEVVEKEKPFGMK